MLFPHVHVTSGISCIRLTAIIETMKFFIELFCSATIDFLALSLSFGHGMIRLIEVVDEPINHLSIFLLLSHLLPFRELISFARSRSTIFGLSGNLIAMYRLRLVVQLSFDPRLSLGVLRWIIYIG